MLIKDSEIRDWKDLQDKVRDLFEEMGYKAESPKDIQLVRGKKEVDVFVSHPHASQKLAFFIECKWWNSEIPQDTVHSLRTVIADGGATNGFIISKIGFQPGAYEAAEKTNIDLLTFEELQKRFGQEWLLTQKSTIGKLLSETRNNWNLYFDQQNYVAAIVNSRSIQTQSQYERFSYYQKWSGCLMVEAQSMPESIYDERVRCAFNLHDLSTLEGSDFFYFNSIREYFKTLKLALQRCNNEFKEFMASCHNQEKDLDFMKQAVELVFLETPVRNLKGKIPDEEFEKILTALRGTPTAIETFLRRAGVAPPSDLK